MREIVIWAVKEGRGYRLGKSNAVNAPIPFSAEIIVRVQACDENLMWEWIKKRMRRGWPIERIKAAC